MTRPTANERLKTEDDFQAKLEELVQEAVANGVDIRGGWEVNETRSDWELHITSVSRVPSD